MGTKQHTGVVVLVVALAFGVGACGSVAAGSAGPLDNETNTTASFLPITSATLDGVENTTSDTAEVIEAPTRTVDETADSLTDTTGTLNETTDSLEATTGTVDETTDSLASTVENGTEETTETLETTTTTLESSVDGFSGLLADDGTLVGMLLTEQGQLKAATGTLDEETAAGTNVTPAVADGSSGPESMRPPTATPARAVTDCRSCGTTASGDSPVSAFLSTVVGLGLLAASRLRMHANLVAGVAPLTVSTTTPAVRTSLAHVAHRLPRVPVVPLYSRFDDSDPLEHEVRHDLVQFVHESPGLPLADVSDQLGLPRSTVRYHVRILEEEQKLMSQNVLGRRRVFPAWMDSPPAVVAAMQDAGTRRVLLTLARIEPASLSRVADDLEKSPSTVSYHLDRLETAGIVVRERDGAKTHNRLTSTARAAFEPEADAAGDAIELPERIRITY